MNNGRPISHLAPLLALALSLVAAGSLVVAALIGQHSTLGGEDASQLAPRANPAQRPSEPLIVPTAPDGTVASIYELIAPPSETQEGTGTTPVGDDSSTLLAAGPDTTSGDGGAAVGARSGIGIILQPAQPGDGPTGPGLQEPEGEAPGIVDPVIGHGRSGYGNKGDGSWDKAGEYSKGDRENKAKGKQKAAGKTKAKGARKANGKGKAKGRGKGKARGSSKGRGHGRGHRRSTGARGSENGHNGSKGGSSRNHGRPPRSAPHAKATPPPAKPTTGYKSSSASRGTSPAHSKKAPPGHAKKGGKGRKG